MSFYSFVCLLFIFKKHFESGENDSPTRKHNCTDFQKCGNTPALMDCETWIRKILLHISGTGDTGVLSKVINLTWSLWTQTSLTKLHFIPHWIHKIAVHVISYSAGCPARVDGISGLDKVPFSLFWKQSQETLKWMSLFAAMFPQGVDFTCENGRVVRRLYHLPPRPGWF